PQLPAQGGAEADLDSVLFLISISADVNSRFRDQTELRPAASLRRRAVPLTPRRACASPPACWRRPQRPRTSGQRRTPLHLACAAGNCDLAGNPARERICRDDGGRDSAAQLAMREGHLPVCRLLLQQHRRPRPQLLSAAPTSYGRENAASIFDCVMAAEPQTSVDLPDAEGNTALLLAYMQATCGSAPPWCGLVPAWGPINKYARPVFNHQLLHTLLDILDKEPGWVDGDFCLECGTRFSLKTRKHHCRHCGRLLCASCSKQQCAIVKYGMRKPE
uniref:FYVE-type domain-containing protein n=1 Tax=Macrostomum lignano TaxID=282301 RepID=A0A1I8FCL7_9PLAT